MKPGILESRTNGLLLALTTGNSCVNLYYALFSLGPKGSDVSAFALSSTGEELQNGLYRLKAFDGGVGFEGLQIVQ